MVRAPVSGHWHWPGRSAAHIPTVLQQSSRQQMLLRGWDQSGGRYGLARHSQQHWKRRQRSARTSGTGGSGDEPGGQPGHVADGEGDAGPARDLRAETYATRRRADATSGATAGAALGQRRGRTGRRRTGNLGDLLRGTLGGVLGGAAAGTVLNGGLGGLLKQFQENGQGDVAHSWIGTGPNKTISDGDLASALGGDTLNTLSQQTGMGRDDLLEGLRQYLPRFVDQLTPDGHVPNEDEAQRLL